MSIINRHVAELKKNGFTIIKNVLSKKECVFFVNRSNLLLNKLLKRKKQSRYIITFKS